MSTAPPPQSPTPQQQLLTLRIIWAAMLAGQVIFLLIVLTLIAQPDGTPVDPQIAQMLFVMALVLLIGGVVAGFFLRMRIYGAARQADGAVSMGAYSTGNIIFLALAEGPSLLAIVGILLARQMWPFLVVTILAIAVQALNFPSGAPTRKH